MATLRLDGIRKRYPNGMTALHGIDLSVADGELIVVVGPSGCGKSTLLRILAGLEPITAGELAINGRRVNELEPAARDIAMVFQNYALYPHMSVAGNMAYALKNRGTPKDEIRRRVANTAALLGLDDLLERRPRQLSGGQRQRVAMGRAIIREPQVFLFDEPLSNLDAKLRVQMRLEIRRLQKRLGITSVYVTHDQVEAMTLADRLVVMNGGHVEQCGTPMALYARPATRFVASFLGSPAMNFLPVTAHAGGVVLPNGAQVALPAILPEGDAATLGIRPEHLVEATASEEAAATLDVTVEMLEPLGADTLAYTRLPGVETWLVVRLDGAHAAREGQRLSLALPVAHCHVFDARGARVPMTGREDAEALAAQ
ncbi:MULTISPECIES: sn-glycerol-3-phosphate ABC transporter ATP-binding protein UgpC [Chromohalobacter]|uniref:sn-glycerol-3-phosphate ABC transporter ATP-binding protein UgpC n=1 Tax=Chromohalobacter TaxID=42054 RepID=UPI0005569C52|nr:MULTISPECIES: sn-glycerol-3-phosphate ABC transporter ATP-binding protein UgpC [Chromohalobacter]MDF9434037.1 sn-glycerol-3-phosphate ABC transporter ATP-binding protein UgpC [Chromohalobacter israelensis]MDO0945892.1 sn-glycerol-3-phosphate ABC transporter ATP-binding protein UgpC [Chromohalobacter salexigens]NQY45049.1 sn-glycerol-3-phosphate ABC transporter ATP-binding protein UgpC [Chromohalobacter sp.]NWO56268.1 sn-glycerol-3-phosphate ABC transporter ATP-binding protein UgpC [Chromohal